MLGWSEKGEDGQLRIKGAANPILSTALKYLHIHSYLYFHSLIFSKPLIPAFIFPHNPHFRGRWVTSGRGRWDTRPAAPSGIAHTSRPARSGIYIETPLFYFFHKARQSRHIFDVWTVCICSFFFLFPTLAGRSAVVCHFPRFVFVSFTNSRWQNFRAPPASPQTFVTWLA